MSILWAFVEHDFETTGSKQCRLTMKMDKYSRFHLYRAALYIVYEKPAAIPATHLLIALGVKIFNRISFLYSGEMQNMGMGFLCLREEKSGG